MSEMIFTNVAEVFHPDIAKLLHQAGIYTMGEFDAFLNDTLLEKPWRLNENAYLARTALAYYIFGFHISAQLQTPSHGDGVKERKDFAIQALKGYGKFVDGGA